MPGILRGHPLTAKHVPQVPAAIVTNNLRSMAVSVLMVIDCIGDFVIEAWPAAMAIKLVLGTIERRIAAPA